MKAWLEGAARDHLVLRAAATLAGLLSLPVMAAAGDLHIWQIVIVVLACTAWYAGPNLTAGATLLAVTVAWIAAVGTALTPWTVAVLWLLLIAHAATGAAGVIPRETNMALALWRLWARHTAVAGAVGSILWLIAWVLVRQQLSGYLVLMFIALAAIGGLALLLRARSLRRDRAAGQEAEA